MSTRLALLTHDTARLSRYLIASAVLAAYIGAALLLQLDANTYLLLSMPVTLLFQVLVRRKPIRGLWLFDAPPFRIDATWLLFFVLLAAFPALWAVQGIQRQDWPSAAYNTVAVLGAAAAAYALRAFDRTTLGHLKRCLLTAGALGVGLMALSAIVRFDPASLAQPIPLGSLRAFAISMLQYVPISFMVEEVLFRGAIDGYLHETDAEPDKGTFSAYYVSTLWALWHLPLTLPLAGCWAYPASPSTSSSAHPSPTLPAAATT